MSELQVKYGERCKTESANSAILEVYEFIFQHEESDTDFWYVGGGDLALAKILEVYFTDFDWGELEKDLKYWTTYQLEIFLYAIMNGYSYYLEESREYHEVADLTRTVPHRTDLILQILHIGIERGKNKNDIVLIAMDSFSFLIHHFAVLVSKDLEYLYKIKQILEIVGKDYIFQKYPEFKDIYEQTERNSG